MVRVVRQQLVFYCKYGEIITRSLDELTLKNFTTTSFLSGALKLAC